MGKAKHGGGGLGSKPAPAPKQSSTRTPDTHATKEQQAAALINQGKLQQAEAIYRELIAAGTRNHIVYGNLGAVLQMLNRHSESIQFLAKAVDINKDFSNAHYNLGSAYHATGSAEAAKEHYQIAIKQNPKHHKAFNNFGNLLKEEGDTQNALTLLQEALRLNPNYPEALNNLGNALRTVGDLDGSIISYKKAIELRPEFPDTYNHLGAALHEQGNLNAAIASYNKALELKPNYPDAHNNLGAALQEQGDLIAAIASFNTALQLKPNYPDAHNNLGAALQEQGNLNAAIASYNKALQLKPNYPEAHWNSSLTRLLGGDYKKGWEKYEWRAKTEKTTCKPHAQPKASLWDGTALGQQGKILLVSEQGLGDTLQFMRYAIAIKEQGASVSICAQPKLHTVIKASGIDASPLTPQQANQVNEGLWIPLLSAPRHLEVSPENPIITNPYIKTTDGLISKWQDILTSDQRPIIGINWQGNPKTEKTGLRGRSIPLEAFAPVTTNSQISLLSLQKGFGSEQLETCSFRDRFVSCQPLVDDTWDFLETAAIIANCDLVITSDTAVAHLAGGMGKTTWLLLHHVPDWRWGLVGETTFWYPSMRLFRQTERGNWDEVLQRVAEALLH